MSDTKMDLLVEIALYDRTNGGRDLPLPSGTFNCLFEHNANFYSCRLFFENGSLDLGKTTKINLKFLYPSTVAKVSESDSFFLHDGKRIASGIVCKKYALGQLGKLCTSPRKAL